MSWFKRPVRTVGDQAYIKVGHLWEPGTYLGSSGSRKLFRVNKYGDGRDQMIIGDTYFTPVWIEEGAQCPTTTP